ncbi:MAG TPA: DNA polymerase III subunit delta' C-terminal domain-containing protein, partial [Roseiflexaceae bacterium]|nr:DNA polymerase III subunit delta' C-terminal domain-containing protein [Roseiflexaceae bacterium]
PEALVTQQAQLDELAELAVADRSAGLRWAEERTREFRSGEQASVYAALELWQSWWRDVLLVAAGVPESITHIDRKPALEHAARRYDIAGVHVFIGRLANAARQIRENVNPQLALEHLILHLPPTRGV